MNKLMPLIFVKMIFTHHKTSQVLKEWHYSGDMRIVTWSNKCLMPKTGEDAWEEVCERQLTLSIFQKRQQCGTSRAQF
jgi:hypothetical protein